MLREQGFILRTQNVMEGLRAECHGIICLLEASLWLLCAVWTGGGEGIASWFLLPLADREEAHHTERVWERCPSLWGVSLQEGFPIIAPSPPESPPFLAKPTASKETLRLPRLVQEGTPKVSSLRHSGQLLVSKATLSWLSVGYPFAMWDERGEGGELTAR